MLDADQDLTAIRVDLGDLADSRESAAKRSRGSLPARVGRYRRADPVRPGESAYDIALDATLKHAALRQTQAGHRPHTPLRIQPDDLHKKVRHQPRDHLIVLLVDSSDSMREGPKARMKAAKGTVLALLRKAYQDRNRIALVAFGGERAKVVLPPTRSINLALGLMKRLPTGGATPFADGLHKAWRIVRQEQLKHPGIRPLLVILSDGEANVPFVEGMAVIPELNRLADALRQDRLSILLIDVAGKAPACAQPQPLAMRQFALRLNAIYLKINDLRSRQVLKAIRQAQDQVPLRPSWL